MPRISVRNRWLLGLAAVAVVAGIVAAELWVRRLEAREPLSPAQIRQLAQTLGLELPASTDSVRVWVDVDEATVNLRLKFTFAEADAAGSRDPEWSQTQPAGDPFAESSAAEPAWFDAAPARPDDLRFSRRLIHGNITRTIHSLLRVRDGQATFYLAGVFRRGAFSPELLAALQKYPVQGAGFASDDDAPRSEREWSGPSLPEEAPPASAPGP